MTAVRHFKPTNRLTRMIRQPGGKTVRSALDEAQAAVEGFRPEVVADIDARIADLEQLTARRDPAPVERDAIYRCASDILEHAGLFGLGDVGEAAYSLCELVDRLDQRGAWDASGVTVHVGSIRLLRETAGAPAERAKVLSGLHAVVAKITGEAQAAPAA